MSFQEPSVHTTPIVSVIISLFSAVIAFISLAQVQVVIALIASGVAILSGSFAVRHFYYTTKKTKIEIKKLEKE